MAPSRFQRSSAVLLAAVFATSSTAFDFSGENDVSQTAGTVAPDNQMDSSTPAPGANGFGTVQSPTQWTSTATSSNNVPTMAPSTPSTANWDQGWTPVASLSTGSTGWQPPSTSGTGWSPPTESTGSTSWTPPSSGGIGSQGWPQPAQSTASSSFGAPPSSGTGSQGWSPPGGSTASSSWTPPSTGGNQDWGSLECESDEGSAASTPNIAFSLECSGSDDTSTPTTGYSLECSGSDDTSTPTTGYSLECSGSDDTEIPATSATGSQGWSPPATSTASSSNTATSTTSSDTQEQGAVETPSPPSSSEDPAPPTTSSGTTDQGSQAQTPSTPSTASSGTTDQGSSQAQTPSTPSTTSSSDTATSTTSSGNGQQQGGSDSTAQTSTRDHASFGDVTSGSDKCVVGNPNTYISAEYVDWVWEHRMGENVTNNKNWIMDHIVHNKGTLNYCVRWDSTEKLSKTVASKFQAMLERQYAAWNHWLIGYDCWPYNEIKVNIVGFAVKDASLLDWTDDSLGTIYTGEVDENGVPRCPQTCYRVYDSANNFWVDTTACKGEPFDLSLWPKQGLEGGFGYDWGQEVNLENMLQTIDQEELTIVSHEIGHGFGLPDFYEVADKPGEDFPKCIMMAGSSMTVTDGDGWMIRRALENVKDRYNF